MRGNNHVRRILSKTRAGKFCVLHVAKGLRPKAEIQAFYDCSGLKPKGEALRSNIIRPRQPDNIEIRYMRGTYAPLTREGSAWTLGSFYALVRLDKPSLSSNAHNPRSCRKWRYETQTLVSKPSSKDWRTTVQNMTTACDALGAIK